MTQLPSDDLLAGLNPAQREAVLHHDGPMLVLAGAGSGKTRVLTSRIVRLVRHHGVDPRTILAVTFTNKAAGEMRERIGRMLGHDPQGMWAGTFHAIGARLLRQHAHLVGRTPSFTIYDEDDTLGLMKRVMEREGVDPKQFTPKGVSAAISDAKNRLVTPGEYERLAMDPMAKATAKVYRRLESALRESNAVTFDDLLVLPVEIMREHPQRLAELRDRFRYVLIDEYQDTNRAQYEFVRFIAGEHGNVMVVGDEDQCLVAGTRVQMADGTERAIEHVRPGDMIRAALGSGRFGAARVARVHVKEGVREGIAITTRAGRRIVSTAEHTHFAGYVLGVVPQMHFVYLMEKRGVGFRIGKSQVYTRGQSKPVVGFEQRLRHEHGDALWIVGTAETEQAARELENVLSLRYRIPTLPFVARPTATAGGLVHDQAAIDRVFAQVDSASGAHALLAQRGLSPSQPHHRPRSRNASRRNVILTLCGDGRGRRSQHRIRLVGNDAHGRAELKRLGFKVRSAKADGASWRYESSFADYDAICDVVEYMQGIFTELNVFQVARLAASGDTPGGTNSLPFTSAAAVMPGMAMFDERGAYDVVDRVDRVPLDGAVYDLDIEGVHNYVANGLVTHNSVYGWRGADIRNILDFQQHFPQAKVVRLEENYRSAPQILELANLVIAANTQRLGKTLRATRPATERVTLVDSLDERDEADFVVEEIAARRSGSSSLLLRDFAILYRTNAQSRALEEAMRRRGFPYRLVGGTRFYDRREIRDLIGYLKLIANPADNEAFRRAVAVPKRGLGDTTIEALADAAGRAGLPLLAAAARPELVSSLRAAARAALADFVALIGRMRERARDAAVDELLRELIDAIKYGDYLKAEGPEGIERLDNVRALIDGAAETVADDGGEVGLTPLDHFLQKATLVAGVDSLDANADAVVLMTMHNAKGLEFPVVFVTGLEDGLFPLAKAYDDPQMLEEERRLFYVGITRAERKLYLTYAEQRRRNGEMLPSRRSGFLDDIPPQMLEQRKTIKVRSSGRAAMGDFGGFGGSRGGGSGGWGRSSWDRAGGGRGAGTSGGAGGLGGGRPRTWDDDDAPVPPSVRRPGSPVERPVAGGARPRPAADAAEMSQDQPALTVGSRVKHKKFGSGRIAELTGAGRDMKVRIDFDDETIGRKTLVVAQANLEPEWD